MASISETTVPFLYDQVEVAETMAVFPDGEAHPANCGTKSGHCQYSQSIGRGKSFLH
jgi:hypothetical protein